MAQIAEPLPPHLAEKSRIGQEIGVTGKWVPTTPGGLFRKSADSKEMLEEWEDIHADARADAGVLSTEINHAVGEDAVLVHHVFKDRRRSGSLLLHDGHPAHGRAHQVAKPQLHLIRGISIPRCGQGASAGEERACDVWRASSLGT